jgi:hypothetical protein
MLNMKAGKMAFNIHITHIHENPTASQVCSKRDNAKKKLAATAKMPIFMPSLVSTPADKVINKYPVRIFTIES